MQADMKSDKTKTFYCFKGSQESLQLSYCKMAAFRVLGSVGLTGSNKIQSSQKRIFVISYSYGKISKAAKLRQVFANKPILDSLTLLDMF